MNNHQQLSARQWIMPLFVALTILLTINACDNFTGPLNGPPIAVDTSGSGGNMTGGCDTNNVSYEKTVLKIVKEQCYSCHSAAIATSGVNLEGYSNLQTKVRTGQLLNVITGAPGFVRMPLGGQLGDCEIRQIRTWINQGAKNN